MGTDIRLTIHNAIEKNKASYFAFLKDLISFDSRILEAGKYGQEKGIQDYLKQYFQKLGAQVDAFSPENEKICKYAGFNKNHTYENRENVVAIFKGAGGGRSLLMNGHCDIVPPGDESCLDQPAVYLCRTQRPSVWARHDRYEGRAGRGHFGSKPA